MKRKTTNYWHWIPAFAGMTCAVGMTCAARMAIRFFAFARTAFFLLFLIPVNTALANSTSTNSIKDPCKNFDRIALQLTLPQNNMPSPLNLNQIRDILGSANSITNHTATTYSWAYNNRVLLVAIDDDRILKRILTGNDDGSVISNKMEIAYTRLQSATSIWTIKDIQKQLGKGLIENKKSYDYNWNCNNGSITVTTNSEKDKIISAKIGFDGTSESIKLRLGNHHPKWDAITANSFGKHHHSWKRVFGN